MLWEHEPQASVSAAFSSSPKLSRVSLSLDRHTENMFSAISFRKLTATKRRIFNQNANSLCSRHHYVNSSIRASSVFPSSYKNTIFNRSVRVFS